MSKLSSSAMSPLLLEFHIESSFNPYKNNLPCGQMDVSIEILHTIARCMHAAIPTMGESAIQMYSLSALTSGSAVVSIYGSYAISKEKSWKGGILNILAGTVVPIPTTFTSRSFLNPSC